MDQANNQFGSNIIMPSEGQQPTPSPVEAATTPHVSDQSVRPQPGLVSKTARFVLAVGIITLVINLAMLIWVSIALSSREPSAATGPAIIWGMVLLFSLPVEIPAIIAAAVHLIKMLIRNVVSTHDLAASIGGIILCLLPAVFIMFLFIMLR